MNNKDNLNAMTVEELANFFCDAMDQIAERAVQFGCDICPVSHLCRKQYNGFRAWLTSEFEEK